MKDQKELIHGKPWKYLIVLDACRYDIFSTLVWEFLDGDLSEAWSPGSCTIEWLEATWTGKYDIVYVSANPFVNSKVPVKGFFGRKHFLRVIDVWDFGWDEKLATVPPKNVSESVPRVEKHRVVVHYIQPHFPPAFENPYMSVYVLDGRKPSLDTPLMRDKRLSDLVKEGVLSLDEYKKLYIENLRTVLKEVAELVPELDGKVVITSDHGEFLGESGMFLHPPGINHPILRKVPWFKVK